MLCNEEFAARLRDLESYVINNDHFGKRKTGLRVQGQEQVSCWH